LNGRSRFFICFPFFFLPSPPRLFLFLSRGVTFQLQVMAPSILGNHLPALDLYAPPPPPANHFSPTPGTPGCPGCQAVGTPGGRRMVSRFFSCYNFFLCSTLLPWVFNLSVSPIVIGTSTLVCFCLPPFPYSLPIRLGLACHRRSLSPCRHPFFSFAVLSLRGAPPPPQCAFLLRPPEIDLSRRLAQWPIWAYLRWFATRRALHCRFHLPFSRSGSPASVEFNWRCAYGSIFCFLPVPGACPSYLS